MQFTSLLALSASLLAAQVPAQYLNPLVNPEAYMNPNIGVNPHPNANPNPNINANPNPNINFNPMATPSVSASASASASFSMHHKPTHAMHSHAYPSMSMGPMNSLIPMHPFHPKSMVTKASSSKASFATPTPTHALHHMHAPPPFHPKHGGIAPVDPLAPGSEVAPVQLDQEHGQDVGNSFCMGSCYSKHEDAKCGKPYSSPLYQSAQNCWMCCFTSPDF